MAILPLQLARVSNLLRTSVATQRLAQTQQQLLNVQNELSSGKKLQAVDLRSPGPEVDIEAMLSVEAFRKRLIEAAVLGFRKPIR